MEQILIAQLDQARRNMAQAAFDEDYAEASVWQNKIEALEDVLTEFGMAKPINNVVNING